MQNMEETTSQTTDDKVLSLKIVIRKVVLFIVDLTPEWRENLTSFSF